MKLMLFAIGLYAVAVLAEVTVEEAVASPIAAPITTPIAAPPKMAEVPKISEEEQQKVLDFLALLSAMERQSILEEELFEQEIIAEQVAAAEEEMMIFMLTLKEACEAELARREAAKEVPIVTEVVEDETVRPVAQAMPTVEDISSEEELLEEEVFDAREN